MSIRPNSRPMAEGYAAKIDALVALGIEFKSIADAAEVSPSTLLRVRRGQPVVRATARSIELAVELLHAKHFEAGPIRAPLGDAVASGA